MTNANAKQTSLRPQVINKQHNAGSYVLNNTFPKQQTATGVAGTTAGAEPTSPSQEPSVVTNTHMQSLERLRVTEMFFWTRNVHTRNQHLFFIVVLNQGLTPPSTLPKSPFSRTVLKTTSKSLGKTAKVLEAQEVQKKKQVSISFLVKRKPIAAVQTA